MIREKVAGVNEEVGFAGGKVVNGGMTNERVGFAGGKARR